MHPSRDQIARDALATIICDGMDDCLSPDDIADAVLALLQPHTITTEAEEWEYGVRRAPRYGSTIAEMHDRGTALGVAKAWSAQGNETTVVRRRVVRGPWVTE